MIKTFRGLLVDGQQERIRLETINGKTGYIIKKFQIIPENPGANIDGVVKVFSIEPGAANGTINFNEQTMIAVAWNYNDTYETQNIIVFDAITFNQDIFVQHYDDKASGSMNYYLELEAISLDDVEATAVILKNFRNTNTVA